MSSTLGTGCDTIIMTGQQLTLWTIRLSLLLYALVVFALLAGPPWSRRSALKWLWAASCGVFLIHVALAFHYYHHWSHSAALAHTADETHRLLGWRFGIGIYFNYLFAILWAADCLWWLVDEPSYRARPAPLQRLVHLYLFFIAFSGAVVFEDGIVRWAGVAVTALLGAALAIRRLGQPRPTAELS